MAPEITRSKSKAAARAYRKRGGVGIISEAEQRRLDRGHELEKRADSIKEKERRKRDNAKKAAEKKEKQRLQRIAQGLPPEEEPKVAASQSRIMGFFANFGKKKVEKDVDEGEESRVESGEPEGRDDSADAESFETEETRIDGDEEEQADDMSSLDAASDAQEFPPSPLPEQQQKSERPPSRKRRFSDMVAMPRSSPVREPWDVNDPLVATKPWDLYVPPSQDSVQPKRPKSAGSTRGKSRQGPTEADISAWTTESRGIKTISEPPPSSQHQSRPLMDQPDMMKNGQAHAEDRPSCYGYFPLTNRHEPDQEALMEDVDEWFPDDDQLNLDLDVQASESTAKTLYAVEDRSRDDPEHASISLRLASSRNAVHENENKAQDQSHSFSTDLFDDFPSDSQIFAKLPEHKSNKTDISRNLLQPNFEDVADLLPSDSQVFKENFASTPKADVAVDELPSPYSPTAPDDQSKLSAQELEELVQGITSSQLAAFDEDIDLDAPMSAAAAPVDTPSSKHFEDEFKLSQESELSPEDLAALDAAAQATPAAKAPSPRRKRKLERIQTSLTDYGDFEISSQELKHLP